MNLKLLLAFLSSLMVASTPVLALNTNGDGSISGGTDCGFFGICTDHNIDDEVDVLKAGHNRQEVRIDIAEQDIVTTNDYISTNEADWLKDLVGGGGGTSTESFADMLSGDRGLFNAYDSFIDWLIMASPLADRMDRIEAMASWGLSRDDPAVKFYAGNIKSERTGEIVMVDGYACDPNPPCIKIE